MCGSMIGIQSATADNRRGKRRKKKPLLPNIMASPDTITTYARP